MTTPTIRATPVAVLRFDKVQRAAHWINALLFGALVVTGIALYFGSFFGIVFQRHVIQEIHLWSGLALPLPILVSIAGPWGARMRDDFGRFGHWTRSEIRWMRTLGRTPLDADKYNPGQKANALFVGSAIVVMWATGYILQWFRFFPVSWRAGATVTHDVLAFALFAAIAGHIFMAVTHREPFVSMFTGTVSEKWAEQHAPAWTEEVPGQD